MKKTQKFIPGLLGSEIEIFTDNDSQLKFLSNGKVRPFADAPYWVIDEIITEIQKDAETKEILQKWHPKSQDAQIAQFASCRFGGLDYRADIENGIFQDGEFHPCPRRGNCEAEGILCKMPIVNGTRLSLAMVDLMRLLSGIDTNEVIAEKIGLPLGSYHELKKKLYAILDVRTKQEVALISRDLMIV